MKRLKGLISRRDIMHTLWPTIGLCIGYVATEFTLVKYLLFSLAVYHLLHLFRDCKFVLTDPKTGRKLHEPVAVNVNDID